VVIPRGACVVIVGDNFLPTAMISSINGNFEQGRRFRAQADARKPLRKRLWASIVREKILSQAAALEVIEGSPNRLKRLVDQVKSGDSTNREAAAARIYWPALMGTSFRRSSTDNTNAMLNYGYAVVRSAAARAACAAGLHPSISLNHVSDGDAFCLADDLMEPFRPAVDLVVHELVSEGASIDSAYTKSKLADAVNFDYETRHGTTPMSNVMVRICQDLVKIFLGEKSEIEFPISKLPLRVSQEK